MSNEELAQALGVDIAVELKAIIGYGAHAMVTNEERANFKTIIFPYFTVAI